MIDSGHADPGQASSSTPSSDEVELLSLAESRRGINCDKRTCSYFIAASPTRGLSHVLPSEKATEPTLH
jgi:hypothetical protein